MKTRILSIVLTSFVIGIGAPIGFGQETEPVVCEKHDQVLSGAAEICGDDEYTCKITCKNNKVKGYNCCCGKDCMEEEEEKR